MPNLDHVPGDWFARGFSRDVRRGPPDPVPAEFVRGIDEPLVLVGGLMGIETGGRRLGPALADEAFIPAAAFDTARNPGVYAGRWYFGYRRR